MARASLISAGLRHLRDAQELRSRSLDQSFHLAGYGPECIRKGCFNENIADKALGHDLTDATEPIVAFLAAYDPEAARYGVEDMMTSLPLLNQANWSPEVRYNKTGSVLMEIGTDRLDQILDEARRYVDERVTNLWADGAIALRDLQ